MCRSDSLQKNNYESIRLNADFDRVMENVQYLYSYCKDRNTFFGISACMMTSNWHEAPYFIKYCNELNVPICFHTVRQPAKYSIKYLSQGRIREIYSRLQPAGVKLPEDNEMQRKNKKHYLDFLNQIHEWGEQVDDGRGQVNTTQELIGYVKGKNI